MLSDAVERAKRLVEEKLPMIHQDLQLLKSNPWCNDESSCKILEYSACHFSSSCALVPGICSFLQELETHLPIFGSCVVDRWQLEKVSVTEFPGRLRLCCPVATEATSCFWLEESRASLQTWTGKLFLVEFIDPRYLIGGLEHD